MCAILCLRDLDKHTGWFGKECEMVERGEAVKTLSSQQLEQLWAEDLKGELETKGKWPLRS